MFPRDVLISCGILVSLMAVGPAISPAVADDAYSCTPVSEPIAGPEGMTADFCSKWNPEFFETGALCCHDPFVFNKRGKRVRRKLRACVQARFKSGSYCGEMTDEQRRYSEVAGAGKLGDQLEFLRGQIGLSGKQGQCGPNNGFLAHGRRIIPNTLNRIQIRSPGRCTEFGTDEMATLMEWLGRKVATQYPAPDYSGVHVLLGDVSAPRGGCLGGRGGRRGHSSHTNGQDADVGFLVVDKGRPSPGTLVRRFDAATNWWFLKLVLQNPFACVKRVFLDRKLISALGRVAGADPFWKKYSHVIQHQKFHKNHFHVRIGDQPGAPGCVNEAPEGVEMEEETDLVSDPTEVNLDEALDGLQDAP